MQPEIRICPNCQKSFVPDHWRRRFCCDKCTWTYHNKNRKLRPNVKYICAICKKLVEKYVEPSKQKISALKYCSRKCKGIALSGENHPMWKGGRRQNDQGYILVYMPDHHEADSKGNVREHRIIMEQYINRRFKTGRGCPP